MKPIQKLEVFSFATQKTTEKLNEVIDRLNSLTGEEKEEPAEENKSLYQLYRVPCFCKRVWGEDGDGDRYGGMAVNLEDETAKARLEGQIEGVEKSLSFFLNAYPLLDIQHEINILKDQLTNLK